MFKKNKIDLGAARSTVMIEAVRAIEVLEGGAPLAIEALKAAAPEFNAVRDAVFKIHVHSFEKGTYECSFGLENNTEDGWAVFTGEIRSPEGKNYSVSFEKWAVGVDSAKVPVTVLMDYSEDRSILGTSWAHRIVCKGTSDYVINLGILKLFRAKS